MNGPARKIEILSPFNQAIELTRLILFRPFDITKWLVIGFAAFLSGWLNSGGGSINPWSFRGWNTSNAQSTFQFRSFNIDHAGLLLVLIAVLVIVFFTFLILWLWITARGRFIFIDCIVRNRAAIAEPWREFRHEGNRFFVFLIVLMVASLAIMALLGGLVFGSLMLWRNYHISNTPALLVLVPIAAFAWVAFAVVVNLIVHFMPPVMYARRCSPAEAARGVLQLVLDEPAPFIFFILFIIALWIGWIMVGCLVTCLNLLSSIVALHRHRHRAAGSRFLSLLFASFLAPIRAGMGCVGKNSGSGGDYCPASADDRPGLAANGSADSAGATSSAGIAEPARTFAV